MASRDRPTALECDAPRVFYVVSHGWHTGIVVNRRDLIEVVPPLEDNFSSGEYLEIGWGDERFYQAPTASLGIVFQAIFWPTPTILHIVTVPYNPRRYFSKSEVVEVSVPQTGYEKLLTFASSSLARDCTEIVGSTAPRETFPHSTHAIHGLQNPLRRQGY
jgi:hypothetical protein